MTTTAIGKHTWMSYFWKTLIFGVICIVFLIGLKKILEHTALVRQAHQAMYEYLQLRLTDALKADVPLPVTIVDISTLPIDDRKTLEGVIDKLATRYHPRAIGVDIDFSPGQDNQWLTNYDPMFFNGCLAITKNSHIPIYLGVSRRCADPPDMRLGAHDYAALAASIAAPKGDSKRMFRWLQVNNHDTSKLTKFESLSSRLADRRQHHLAGPVSHPKKSKETPQGYSQRFIDYFHLLPTHVVHFFVRDYSDEELIPVKGIATESFLVNYAPLERLQHERIPYKELSNPAKDYCYLYDQVILIGDAKPGSSLDENYVIPNRHEMGYPGVYVHACATYTLLTAKLYGLTSWGEIALDTLLALCIIMVILLVQRKKYHRQTAEQTEYFEEHIHPLVTWGIIIISFLLCLIFVNQTKIMWDDFPLVILGLFAHRPLDILFRGAYKQIRREHSYPQDNAVQAGNENTEVPS